MDDRYFEWTSQNLPLRMQVLPLISRVLENDLWGSVEHAGLVRWQQQQSQRVSSAKLRSR